MSETEVMTEEKILTPSPDSEAGTDLSLSDAEDGTAIGEEDSVTELAFEEELAEIAKSIPELNGAVKDIGDNKRYAELRALGLSPREAYLATSPIERRSDNRSHLTASVPRGASAPSLGMSREELNMARSIFENLDEREIRRLYKTVTR